MSNSPSNISASRISQPDLYRRPRRSARRESRRELDVGQGEGQTLDQRYMGQGEGISEAKVDRITDERQIERITEEKRRNVVLSAAHMTDEERWREEIKRDIENRLNRQVREALRTPPVFKPAPVLRPVAGRVHSGTQGETGLKPWQLLQQQYQQRRQQRDLQDWDSTRYSQLYRNKDYLYHQSTNDARPGDESSARREYLRTLRSADISGFTSATTDVGSATSALAARGINTVAAAVNRESRDLSSTNLSVPDTSHQPPPIKPSFHSFLYPTPQPPQDNDEEEVDDGVFPLYEGTGYHLSTEYFRALYEGGQRSGGSWARRPHMTSEGPGPPGDVSELSPSEQLSYFYTFTRSGFQHALRHGRLADGSELVQVGVGSYKDRYGLIRDLHGPFWPVDYGPLYPAPVHIRPEPTKITTTKCQQPGQATAEVREHVYPARWRGLSVVYDSERSSRDHAPPTLGQGHCLSLVFESRFESGNLRQARRVGEFTYELVLQTDLYTSRHTQWFYFRVTGAQHNVVYTFRIINLHKRDSLYSNGMQPLLYSERLANEKQEGWRRAGHDISYTRNLSNLQCPLLSRDRAYYQLEWKMEFPCSNDTCYVAHCYPYTFTDLRNDLDLLIADEERSKVMKREVMCTTRSGNSCFLVTVTDFDMKNGVDKKGVVITARVHPGETNSSWIMKGLLEYLTGPSKSARELRRRLVFKIVPMLNPDGVIVGNYRCSLAARDLNRNYRNPSRETFPTVWHTKHMVESFRQSHSILFYCDIHGHSMRQNVFMYGCSSASDWTTAVDSQLLLPGSAVDLAAYLRDRVIPWLMKQQAPDMFSFEGCHYRIERNKEATGRVVMYRQCNIKNSFTMEASFGGTNLSASKVGQGHQFSTIDLEEMGRALCDMAMTYKRTIDDKMFESKVLMQLAKYLMLQVLRQQRIRQGLDALYRGQPRQNQLMCEKLGEESENLSIKREDVSKDSSLHQQSFDHASMSHLQPTGAGLGEMIDSAASFEKCLKIMEDMRLSDTLSKISGSSSDSDSESDPEGTLLISAECTINRRAKNRNKKSKSSINQETSCEINKESKNNQSVLRTFGEEEREGQGDIQGDLSLMLKRRKQLAKTYPVFVNQYEGRSNNGIPCYTQERLQNRASKRQGDSVIQREDTVTVQQFYSDSVIHRIEGETRDRRLSPCSNWTETSLYQPIPRQQQQSRLQPILLMPRFPHDLSALSMLRSRSTTALNTAKAQDLSESRDVVALSGDGNVTGPDVTGELQHNKQQQQKQPPVQPAGQAPVHLTGHVESRTNLIIENISRRKLERAGFRNNARMRDENGSRSKISHEQHDKENVRNPRGREENVNNINTRQVSAAECQRIENYLDIYKMAEHNNDKTHLSNIHKMTAADNDTAHSQKLLTVQHHMNSDRISDIRQMAEHRTNNKEHLANIHQMSAGVSDLSDIHEMSAANERNELIVEGVKPVGCVRERQEDEGIRALPRESARRPGRQRESRKKRQTRKESCDSSAVHDGMEGKEPGLIDRNLTYDQRSVSSHTVTNDIGGSCVHGNPSGYVEKRNGPIGGAAGRSFENKKQDENIEHELISSGDNMEEEQVIRYESVKHDKSILENVEQGQVTAHSNIIKNNKDLASLSSSKDDVKDVEQSETERHDEEVLRGTVATSNSELPQYSVECDTNCTVDYQLDKGELSNGQSTRSKEYKTSKRGKKKKKTRKSKQKV